MGPSLNSSPKLLRLPSDDDEDETAELQRELEKIKRERAEKREREVGQIVQSGR